jgi:hypothetical protein
LAAKVKKIKSGRPLTFPLLVCFLNFDPTFVKELTLIRYLKHNEIDPEKWDRCIQRSVNSMVYATTWYLDLVNGRWEGLVQNDYERVMPLTPGRKFGIDYLFQPPFTQQLGIFSQTHLTDEVVQNFLIAIPSRYRFIEINLNTHNKVKKADSCFTQWLTHELDLIGSYEDIRNGYSTNLKRNIKKAQAAKVSIVENVKPDDVVRVFRQNKGKQLANLKDSDYDLLRRMIYVMIYKRMAYVVGAYNETNDLCAGAFFVYSNKKVIFYFSATDEMAKASGAMPLLIDHFIRKHANAHITLDFEGSNDPNLARFYKSFGANEVTYPHYKINKLNPLLKLGVALVKSVTG